MLLSLTQLEHLYGVVRWCWMKKRFELRSKILRSTEDKPEDYCQGRHVQHQSMPSRMGLFPERLDCILIVNAHYPLACLLLDFTQLATSTAGVK